MYQTRTGRVFEREHHASGGIDEWSKKDIVNVMYLRVIQNIIDATNQREDSENYVELRLQLFYLKKDCKEDLAIRNPPVVIRITNKRKNKQSAYTASFNELDLIFEKLSQKVNKPEDMEVDWWPTVFPTIEKFERAIKLMQKIINKGLQNMGVET